MSGGCCCAAPCAAAAAAAGAAGAASAAAIAHRCRWGRCCCRRRCRCCYRRRVSCCGAAPRRRRAHRAVRPAAGLRRHSASGALRCRGRAPDASAAPGPRLAASGASLLAPRRRFRAPGAAYALRAGRVACARGIARAEACGRGCRGAQGLLAVDRALERPPRVRSRPRFDRLKPGVRCCCDCLWRPPSFATCASPTPDLTTAWSARARAPAPAPAPRAMMEDPAYAGQMKEIVYENTYITEPAGYGPAARFRSGEARAVLRAVLRERVEKQQYDPVKAAHITKHIAEDLREKIKGLGCDRYKCARRGGAAVAAGAAAAASPRSGAWPAPAAAARPRPPLPHPRPAAPRRPARQARHLRHARPEDGPGGAPRVALPVGHQHRRLRLGVLREREPLLRVPGVRALL
jgi:hypothetical protein